MPLAFLIGAPVPYSESFKAEALQDLFSSGRSVAAVARERGIASSTLLRWQAEHRTDVPPASTRQSRDDLEIDELVTWLDREEGEVRAQLQRSSSRHGRLLKAYNNFAAVLGGAVFFAAAVVAFVVYRDLQAAEPATTLRSYVAWTLGLMVAVQLVCLLLDALLSCAVGLGGPFVMAVVRLLMAEDLLAQDTSYSLVDPRWWHVRARWRRRRLRRSLRHAEALLSRRTRLGKAFRTVGAREWELAQRYKAASALAAIEVQLEQEGAPGYELARMRLRQLAYLTLLREWAVDRLPQLPEVASRYQSPMVRLAQRVWLPVPVLGAVVTLVLAIPEIRNGLL